MFPIKRPPPIKPNDIQISISRIYNDYSQNSFQQKPLFQFREVVCTVKFQITRLPKRDNNVQFSVLCGCNPSFFLFFFLFRSPPFPHFYHYPTTPEPGSHPLQRLEHKSQCITWTNKKSVQITKNGSTTHFQFTTLIS